MIERRVLGDGLEIRSSSDAATRAFIASHPLESPYHGAAWSDLLAQAFGYTPLVVAELRGERIVGALPASVVTPMIGKRRLVALPFSHDVPFLLSDEGTIGALLRGLRLAARGLDCETVEVRSGIEAVEDFVAQPALLQTKVALAEDDEAQLLQMKESTRQQTVQGLKNSGLRVATATTIDDLRLSYRLISETRRRKGSLTYPRSLFDGLLPWVESGRALVEIARLDDRAVATTVTLCLKKTAIYMYGGSLGDEAALRSRPYNVLLFRALRFARDAGAECLDLGTSLPTQTGLIRFKEGLGGRTRPLAYVSWPKAVPRPEQEGGVAKLAGAILRRLPLPIFERLTPLILRQVG